MAHLFAPWLKRQGVPRGLQGPPLVSRCLCAVANWRGSSNTCIPRVCYVRYLHVYDVSARFRADRGKCSDKFYNYTRILQERVAEDGAYEFLVKWTGADARGLAFEPSWVAEVSLKGELGNMSGCLVFYLARE